MVKSVYIGQSATKIPLWGIRLNDYSDGENFFTTEVRRNVSVGENPLNGNGEQVQNFGLDDIVYSS